MSSNWNGSPMVLADEFMASEVGRIPRDWQCVPISSLIKEAPKNGYSGQTVDDDSGTPTLSLAATTSGRLVLNKVTIKYLRETIPCGSSLFLEPNDVLIQRSNTAELVGTTAIFDGPAKTFVYPDLMIRVRFKEPETASWFWRIANSRMGRSFFRATAAGSTGSMPKVSGAALKQMMLPLPPPSERVAIATALADVDALISGLDKLIAKKRAIKLAAMQQLLTCKMRLPGFSEKWIERTVEQFAPLQRGFDLPNRLLEPGPYPVVYSNGVLHCHARFMVHGPGIITGRSGTIGKLFFVDEPFWPHNTTLWVTSFNGNDPKFVFYFYSRFGFERFSAGTGVPTLNRNDLHDQVLLVPSEPDEQKAIAAALSDMDTEIAALERRRDKIVSLKQGMMQQLLTGRVRVLQPEVVG